MLQEWVTRSLEAARAPATFYAGARKILRPYSFSIQLGPKMTIRDAGFTKSKLTMLKRFYYHEESIAAAQAQWARCLARRKYSSSSFHCYNHFLKADPAKKSKRASVMGPCLQAVSLTWLAPSVYSVDVFYRTTELFKKFPADLVFIRDALLPHFEIEAPTTMQFHFANVTCHPMYFVTLIPHLSNPTHELAKLRKADKYFHDWTVKWTARYICDEYMRGIQKFAQAMRVRMDAHARIGATSMATLQDYCRKYHPGYKGDKK